MYVCNFGLRYWSEKGGEDVETVSEVPELDTEFGIRG